MKDGRIIAIGDIHGCATEFATLLEKLAPTRRDRIILLGDLVNRGPDSAGVIALARQHAHRARCSATTNCGCSTTACVLPGRTLVQVPARGKYDES